MLDNERLFQREHQMNENTSLEGNRTNKEPLEKNDKDTFEALLKQACPPVEDVPKDETSDSESS